MSTEALSARELAKRLVARAAAPGDARDGAALAAHAACEHACGELSRSLGALGFNALFKRALAQEEVRHPLLKEVRVGQRPPLIVNDITVMVETHGAPAVAAGLEATLETMMALLGRLIGLDVVVRLVERNPLLATHDDEDEK